MKSAHRPIVPIFRKELCERDWGSVFRRLHSRERQRYVDDVPRSGPCANRMASCSAAVASSSVSDPPVSIAAVAIAEVANRPIVVDSETMLGYGGTGGFVASPTSIAEETALLAMRVLNGQLPFSCHH